MEAKEKIQFFAQLSLLSTLSMAEIEQVAHLAQLRRATKFQFVFMPDEPSDYLYILVKGRLKSGTFSDDGREVIKEILQPMAIFGDFTLAGEKKRADFAQAMFDEAEYFCIKINEFRLLMQANQRLMLACMQHLSERLQRVEERLSSLILKDARERIIGFLVDSAEKEGKRIGYETLVKHRLTQQEIANLTGTSRQTVTSVFNDLRKHNKIYFNRSSILIRDVGSLA